MIKLSQSISSLLKQKNFSPLILGELENKTLFIKCKNPTWKNELQYQKKEILNKLNQETSQIEKIVLI